MRAPCEERCRNCNFSVKVAAKVCPAALSKSLQTEILEAYCHRTITWRVKSPQNIDAMEHYIENVMIPSKALKISRFQIETLNFRSQAMKWLKSTESAYIVL